MNLSDRERLALVREVEQSAASTERLSEAVVQTGVSWDAYMAASRSMGETLATMSEQEQALFAELRARIEDPADQVIERPAFDLSTLSAADLADIAPPVIRPCPCCGRAERGSK